MAENRKAPVAGQIYKHFKGTLYKVLAVAVHTETEEKLVVYQSVESPDRTFARPLDMFMSDVDRFRYPLIRAKYRFTLVEECCKEAPETDSIETDKIEQDVEINSEEDIETNTDSNTEKDTEISDDTAKYKEDGELVLDPYVEAVLDEKEFSKKIENFEFLRGKCTEDMLTMIAISLDIQLEEGSVEEKYAQILKTLRMHEKYESSRLRG